MKLAEPPSRIPSTPRILIGKNRQGHWIAREQNGLFGGVFVNRSQALKYALSVGHHSELVVELTEEIELDIF
ncbi:hypothetical protein GGD66_002344 [Bradyrhizobium sp. CIR48]|uniref:hypothetical protein n=1 Tax=Bradyrhizobium sp. CIR48 TaxID=2663840 RepID=UPI0016060165|nr:hypothetical protein [Bradyrhizobium sp. CIR48]MBB4423800.1 hypothetical protein [Bradyrhizobium sp. CIR48]